MPRLGSRVRVSFSAQRTKDSIKLSFFCALSGRVRDHIDNPSKPPFDKGGFAWSGVASKVKLLDIPLSILKKYEPTRINGYLLPVLSNAKYNLYLKEIATTLGIQKRVTSHLARHTFVMTVTYANGVSIESISKMLGHTKLATTQIYARIVDQTVSREMDKLSAALSGTSFSLNGGETSTHETTN